MHARARWAWILSAAAACALHAVALRWGVPERKGVVADTVRRQGTAHVRFLELKPVSGAAPNPVVPAQRAPPRPRPHPDSAELRVSPAASATEPSSIPRAAPIEDKDLPLYFATEDVDRAARPIGSWQVPIEILMAKGRLVVQLRVWVSAEGWIDRLEPLHEVEDEKQRAVLETLLDSLRQTPMRPATKGGRPVPNVRTIEMVITSDELQ